MKAKKKKPTKKSSLTLPRTSSSPPAPALIVKPGRTAPPIPKRAWERYPDLPEAVDSMRKTLQARKRHKQVRYLLFRLRTLADQGKPTGTLDGVFLPPGFEEHFLTEEIALVELPNGKMARIVDGRLRTPLEIGGLRTFASRWDVDENLEVYSRHRSVWSNWNDTLRRVAPVLGEDEG